jgi:hypothetical protein
MREAAAKVPAASVMSLRRPLIMAAIVACISLVVTGLLGHIVMGLLIGVGLVLGLFNTRMLQKSVAQVVSSGNPTKRALGIPSAQRLLVVTAIAFALGFFVRPDGLGVFLGLALFQFIIVGNTVVPVMKERRKS